MAQHFLLSDNARNLSLAKIARLNDNQAIMPTICRFLLYCHSYHKNPYQFLSLYNHVVVPYLGYLIFQALFLFQIVDLMDL